MQTQPQQRTSSHGDASSNDARNLQILPQPNHLQLHTDSYLDLNSSSRNLSLQYTLAPTIPSPFNPTLDASLEAILQFSRIYPPSLRITNILLKQPSESTNWNDLLHHFLYSGERVHVVMVHELLFLVTRQLLPNQIMANREFLRRLYTEKQRVQKRLMLRYDMLHAWKKDDYGRLIIVPSKRSHVPTHVHATQVSASSIAMSQVPDAINDPPLPIRRPLASNILSTLIAAPVEGYSTQITAEKMNHYITRLDDYLVITDSEAETWSMKMLEVKVAEILLSWQWLRINNEKLEELEVHGWEGLTGKEAEDWMADR